MGVGGENLRQHELVKLLAIPKIKGNGQGVQSFTGSDGSTAAAGTRGGGAGKLMLERVC
jgi:hypothetical protein